MVFRAGPTGGTVKSEEASNKVEGKLDRETSVDGELLCKVMREKF